MINNNLKLFKKAASSNFDPASARARKGTSTIDEPLRGGIKGYVIPLRVLWEYDSSPLQ